MKKLLIALTVIIMMQGVHAGIDFNAGFDANIATHIQDSWMQVIDTNGWSEEYNTPQYKFSELAREDNVIDVGEIGETLLAMDAFKETQFETNDSALTERIQNSLQVLLDWQWVPAGTSWGMQDGATQPNGSTTKVVSTVQGVVGAGNVCADATVNFNEHYFAGGSTGYQLSTNLRQHAAAVTALFRAAEHETDTGKKAKYIQAATSGAEAMLSVVVTTGANFGVEQSLLTNTSGGEVVLGMMPSSLVVNQLADTQACNDGGSITFKDAEKDGLLYAAIAFKEAYAATNDARYQTASTLVREGVYALRECDGYFQNKTLFNASGVRRSCVHDDTGESFDAYAQSIQGSTSQEVQYDTAYILYLTQMLDQESYSSNADFQESLQYMLALEQDVYNVGLIKHQNVRRFKTSNIDGSRKPFAKALLGQLFLRASCQETDATMKAAFEEHGLSLTNEVIQNIASGFGARKKNNFETKVGKHSLALKAMAETWELITEGCVRSPDADGDGYKNASIGDGDDCNDKDASIHPGAIETCDNVDNNCDGNVDESFDFDNDGVTTCNLDCDDRDNSVYPGNVERNDGKDNDCDAIIDEGDLTVEVEDGSNAEVQFFDYASGSCANSFVFTSENLSKVTSGCNAVAECTTDSAGNCAVVIEAGTYAVIATKGTQSIGENNVLLDAGSTKTVSLSLETSGTTEEQDTSGNTETTGSTDTAPPAQGSFIDAIIQFFLGLFGG